MAKIFTRHKNNGLPEPEMTSIPVQEEEIRPKKKGRTITILVLAVLLLACIGIGGYHLQHRNDIKIKVEYELFLGRDYKTVKKSFRNLGFTQIDYQTIDDLTKNDETKAERVTEVSIDGITPFESKKWYSKDAAVLITYHVLNPEREMDICLHQDAREFVGQNCRIVLPKLKDAGFTNIEERIVSDLTMDKADQANLITVITINGDPDYRKDTWVEPNSRVEVLYHIVDPERQNDLQIPGNASSYLGQNYEVVAQKFQSAGFTNIQYVAMNDLGWLSNDGVGEITEISINGDHGFAAGTWVSPDTEIVLTYHSKKAGQTHPNASQTEQEKNNNGNWFDRWWPIRW